MKKIAVFLVVAFVLSAGMPLAALADTNNLPEVPPERVICEGFVKPLRMATADDGSIYVLDGMVMKKYKDGQITEVANLLNDGQYFAKYNLGEVEDLYSFRPGTMVYKDGAVYMCGLMVDRLKEPKIDWYKGPGRSDNLYLIGSAYTVTVKVTDHFEPLLVEIREKYLTLSESELHGLLLNDPMFTDDWKYEDYTTRYGDLIVPNLMLFPDGNMYVIKDTAIIANDWAESKVTITNKGISKLYDEKEHGFYIPVGRALYRIYPDGRQELVDEGTYSMKEKEKTTLSSFMVSNKYLRSANDPDPDNDTVYALPSQEEPEEAAIVCNESFIWKYYFKKHTHKQLDFIPGNEMPSGNRTALIPAFAYSPTMPRATKTLGIFFLGNNAVWRLYADRYYQDMYGLPTYSAGETADWAVEENTRTIYQLLTDGRLIAVDFSQFVHYEPKTDANGNFEMPGNAPGNLAFKVMFDQNRQTIYSVNGAKGPYKKGQSLYVPIDPVAYVLGISVHDDSIFETTGGHYAIKLSNPNFNTWDYLSVEVRREGDVIQKHADLNQLMGVIYQLTGMKYKTRYDATTNTLYIQPESSAIQLFKGWWQ